MILNRIFKKSMIMIIPFIKFCFLTLCVVCGVERWKREWLHSPTLFVCGVERDKKGNDCPPLLFSCAVWRDVKGNNCPPLLFSLSSQHSSVKTAFIQDKSLTPNLKLKISYFIFLFTKPWYLITLTISLNVSLSPDLPNQPKN